MKTSNLLTLNPSRELRLALLAAMETSWVFVVIAFLAAQIDQPRALTPLPFFIAYWLALVIGRALPHSRRQWTALQVIAIAIAATTVLAVIRVELFPALEWHDVAWLPRALAAILSITRGIATEHLVTAGVLYVFIRGLGFAQRPLTLWFIGFQFRLGIVVFFLLFVVAGLAQPFRLTQPFDPTRWIFVYFFVSLLALALARIEEMGNQVRYGLRWIVTILGSITLVLFIGLGILQFFNPESARALLVLLMPLWLLVTALILVLAIPAAYLAGWLTEKLKPIFERVAQFFTDLANLVPHEIQETLQHAPEAPLWVNVENTLKTLVVPLALLIVAYFLARALHRRMKQLEAETYVRESIGVDEATEHARRGAIKKPRPRRSLAQHFAAETIRRIYAALIARAAAVGLPRRVAETPYEFLPRLQARWLAASDDLRTITEAYIAVHYGELDAPVEQVNRVRAAWRRVERAIGKRAEVVQRRAQREARFANAAETDERDQATLRIRDPFRELGEFCRASDKRREWCGKIVRWQARRR